MIINNFLYRVAQYLHENRAKLIKILLILAAAILAFVVIRTAVEEWQRSKYEKRVQALEQQVQAAETNAREAEDRAAAMQSAIEIKYAELRNLETRAASAEAKLRETRRAIAPLKETYEATRDNPDVPADTTCADACAELAALGHPCG